MRAYATTRIALVVEDDVLLRSDIVSELQSHGWLVLETPTGEGALALLRTHHVDVVFTDIQLAGRLNGWDVAEVLHDADCDLPIIYTSGAPADPARRPDGSVFFNKPYDSAEVVKACGRLAGAGSH